MHGRLKGGRKTVLDGVRRHAHQQREGLRGDVIGPLRWAAGIQAQVRVLLAFHHRFSESRIGLLQPDDIRAGRILAAIGGKLGRRLLHLYLGKRHGL